MWLLFIALLGLVVANGFFDYWLLFEFHGLTPVLQEKLALGFILDVLLAPASSTSILPSTRSGQ